METVIAITRANAETYLIHESSVRPVLVDFWAQWCAPCKTLKPLLERLAAEYQGAFLLATVDADAERMLAAEFGVQSLPTVMLMKDGQPIDGFTGALPEAEIRAFLERHLPKPWDLMLDQGRQLLAQGQLAEASQLFRTAYTDSLKRADIACELASVLISLKRFDEAKAIIDGIKMIDQGAPYQHVLAQWELASNAQKAPAIIELEALLSQRPEDVDIIHQLALQYAQQGYSREALELLMGLLSRNLSALDGVVRRSYTDILTTLGKSDPLSVLYQRKLYTLLY